jgi:hypothetical protein
MLRAALFATVFAPLLALDETDQPMLVWWIIGGLIALGPALHSWIKVLEWFKGKGIDPSQFVTQDQLAAVKAERDAQITATIKEIRDDFNKLEKTLADIARDLPAIHRALGRLEGHDHAQETRRRS